MLPEGLEDVQDKFQLDPVKNKQLVKLRRHRNTVHPTTVHCSAGKPRVAAPDTNQPPKQHRRRSAGRS